MYYPHTNKAFHDIHLLHHNTTTEDILSRLLDEFTLEKMMGVNIVYFPGDLFDRGVPYADSRISDVKMVFVEMMHICSQTKTKVRLLEGTPSHDSRQGAQLASLIKTMKIDVDFRYVDDMEIEYISDFDMTVMYVPDEWASRDEMYLKARSLLQEHQLDKVDFIIGHNQFTYQFHPRIRAKISALNEEHWNDMVKHTAYFGHVHKRSTYKKIEVAGSFDRLVHGEEDPKGYLEGRYYDEHHQEIIFHENKKADLYLTLPFPEEDYLNPETLNQFIQECLKPNLEQPISRFNIRIQYQKQACSSYVKQVLSQLTKICPTARFTELYTPSQTEEITLEETNTKPIEYLSITPQNIVRLIEEQYTDETVEEQQEIKQLLLEYLGKMS